MTKMNIGWELYRTFLGVLTEGSLSGAARALGITQPTAGRHVEALEKALGTLLFTRSPAGLMPTEAAQALRPQALAMASLAASIERTAASQGGPDGGVKGVVRVGCSEVIGIEVLPPVIAGLQRSHPALKVELVLTDRVQDLLHREADIAVRMATPRQEQLVARRLGHIDIGLHARRDYLERHGTPRNLEQLATHTLIGYDQATAFIRQMEGSLQGLRRDMFSLRSDSHLAQWALIRAGAGIGLCQVPLARRSPDLVRLLPRSFSVPMETWVTMHEDLRGSPRCRATFDALVEGMLTHMATR
ncbi:LysR family transcriptional regulator [Paracidovorax konjaci]|uniref:DNA-binding transcriptional regulator, LysR family n=1 Tax=Paracidovorax konjaci TaxID=32040 RepID=A0A1I1XP86_9BURK|nr:LysR family transcriptional regulator [Paracidovorax konjaci]SFE09159.1 DNA-binding transcriptional regulator, LysR family [Paracidovorax konjaci]